MNKDRNRLLGERRSEFRKVKDLAGTPEKDFKFERLCVVFPLIDKDNQGFLGLYCV